MSVLGWPSTTNIRSAGTYLESNEGTEDAPGPSGTIYCGIEGYTSGTVVFSLEWAGDGADPTVWSDPGDGHIEISLPTDSFKYYNGLLIIRATVDGSPTDNQLELVIVDDNSDPMFYSDWAWTSEPYEAPVEPVFWTDFVAAAEYTGMELRKDTTSIYVPGQAGIPGSPAVPARPAYSYTEMVRECSFQFGSGGEVFVGTGGSSGVGGSADQNAGYYAAGGYVCRDVPRIFHVAAEPGRPAVPAVTGRPASTQVEYNLGWNAGAHSINTLRQSGYARFNVSEDIVGAVVGFNPIIDADVDYRLITHGFYLAGGVAQVYEGGVLKASAGAYTSADQFEIRRVGATVTYFVDSVLVYTSLALSSGPVALDATLYSGGDAVLTPELKTLDDDDAGGETGEGFGFSVGLLPAFRAIGGEGSPVYARGIGVFAPFYTDAGVSPRSAGVFPAFVGIGAGRDSESAPATYQRSIGVLPAFTSYAYSGGLVPSYGLAAGVLSAFSLAAHGTTGGIGQGEGSFLSFIALGSEGAYARSAESFPSFIGHGSAPEGLSNATLASLAFGSSTLDTGTFLFVSMTSTGQIASVFAAELVLTASMLSQAAITGSLLTTYELQALLFSYANAAGIDTQSQADGEVWVVNLESNASTRYDNFTFNSFAKIGDTYYGARDGGIYALDTVDADAGEPIQALVNLGRQDFGSPMVKRIESAYMAVSSYGTMYLRITDHDGQAYTYAARRNTSKLEQQRIDVGRGIEANFLTFELMNSSEGEDFELSGVEFMAVNLTRRIR